MELAMLFKSFLLSIAILFCASSALQAMEEEEDHHSSFPFRDLPKEIQVMVIEYNDIQTLGKLACTSQEMNDLALLGIAKEKAFHMSLTAGLCTQEHKQLVKASASLQPEQRSRMAPYASRLFSLGLPSLGRLMTIQFLAQLQHDKVELVLSYTFSKPNTFLWDRLMIIDSLAPLPLEEIESIVANKSK